MEYTEENAALAYERHPDTHPNQRRVWKTRNAIPDKYFDDNAVVRKRTQALAAPEGVKQDRLQLVLSSEKMHTAMVWKMAEMPVPAWLAKDFGRGKVMLTDAERIGITAAVQKLRALIRNTLAQTGLLRRKGLVKLATDPRLHKVPVFGKDLARKLAPAAKPDADSFTRDELDLMADRLALFLLETHLS